MSMRFTYPLGMGLILLLAVTACQQTEPMVTNCSNLVLAGSLVKASDVAYTTFVGSLKKMGENSDLENFAREVENYDMHVKEQSDTYTFTFFIRHYHGRSLKGGGASFVIQKNTYKVLSAEYYK